MKPGGERRPMRLDPQRREWLDGVVRDAVPPAALAAAMVVGGLALVNPLMLAPEAVAPLTLSGSLVSLGNWLLWLRVRRHPVSVRLAHPLAALVGCSLLASTGIFLAFIPDPRQVTTLMLVSVAAGGLLASRRWL